jgi:hypothetical protein
MSLRRTRPRVILIAMPDYRRLHWITRNPVTGTGHACAPADGPAFLFAERGKLFMHALLDAEYFPGPDISRKTGLGGSSAARASFSCMHFWTPNISPFSCMHFWTPNISPFSCMHFWTPNISPDPIFREKLAWGVVPPRGPDFSRPQTATRAFFDEFPSLFSE